jgi:hypothetical protein
LWDDLRSLDGAVALRSLAALGADPARAVALCRERLKPVTPEHEQRLRRAIAELEDADFRVRDRALEELRRIGPDVWPTLRELQRTTASPMLQARLRAFLTLAELEGVSSSSEAFREARAVQLLERIGTPEARQVLEEVAQGAPSARLTEEAKAALGRLGSSREGRP